MAFLAAGMIVFWGCTFVLVLTMARRERRLEEELEVLKDTIEEQEGAQVPS